MIDKRYEKTLKELNARIARYKNPILYLAPLEKAVIHVPTIEEVQTLRNIFKGGGCMMDDSDLLAQSVWMKYRKNPCAYAEVYSGKFRFANMKDYLEQDGREHHASDEREIVTLGEYCNMQKITPKILKKVNRDFNHR